MNERVGVLLALFADQLRRSTTHDALLALPVEGVLGLDELHVPVGAVEDDHPVLDSFVDDRDARGILGLVQRPAGDVCGEARDSGAEDHVALDVVAPQAGVWLPALEADHQSLEYLAEEDARLGGRVEPPVLGIGPHLRRERVEHGVGDLRRGEDLVVGELRQRLQHVWHMERDRRAGTLWGHGFIADVSSR